MKQTEKIISGIQQIGVGVPDLDQAFRWYRNNFGMDIRLFEDDGEAALMLAYTGGKPQARHALLAGNLRGGSCLEVWQFTKRKTEAPGFSVQLGDLGIYSARIKTHDVQRAREEFRARKLDLPGNVVRAPDGSEHFFLRDPFGMVFQVVGADDWFSSRKTLTGGVCGCMIGVSDVDWARTLYSAVLGYDQVIYDQTGIFDDLAPLPGHREKLRRVLLTHTGERKGSFSRWLGKSRIELVQSVRKKGRKIFSGRYWGDLGFIHLCFDINGMNHLLQDCAEKGFPTVVDSAKSFDMGEAAGRFSYIEDPDGTLIEFVETHKIPIVEKLGWYLDLTPKDPEKPLPNWMLKLLSLNRVKD